MRFPVLKHLAWSALIAVQLGCSAAALAERTDPNDLFVHSTIFVVVDKQGRLRGSFESVGDHVSWPDARQAILDAVRKLENES